MEHATIINLRTREPIQCMFNPKEYTLSKQNRWEEKPAKGHTVPHLEYGGGGAAVLKLQLLFDTLEDHPKGVQAGKDVREHTNRLWALMEAPEEKRDSATGKGEPPHCQFKWGSQWMFDAIIESISQKFVLFAQDGTPLRAILDVTFKQIKHEKEYDNQNPTSGGKPGSRLHTIREGETLAGIAFEVYGDATVWRLLADANTLADPRRLQPGQVLLVPPLLPR